MSQINIVKRMKVMKKKKGCRRKKKQSFERGEKQNENLTMVKKLFVPFAEKFSKPTSNFNDILEVMDWLS